MKEVKYKPRREEIEELENSTTIGKVLAGKKKTDNKAIIEKQRRKSLETYYSQCAFPKPQDKKKSKKVNGYKNKQKRFCYYCGTPAAERHEVFFGRNRQISIDNGFQVDLCKKCHEEIHRNKTQEARRRNEYWRKRYQKEYEEKLIRTGITSNQARELWLNLIGRNYL